MSAVLTVALAGCSLGQMDPDPSPSEQTGTRVGLKPFATTTWLLPRGKLQESCPKCTFPPGSRGVLKPFCCPCFFKASQRRITLSSWNYTGNSGKQNVINRAGTLPCLTDVEMHLGRRKRRRERKEEEERRMPRARCCSLHGSSESTGHEGGCSR